MSVIFVITQNGKTSDECQVELRINSFESQKFWRIHLNVITKNSLSRLWNPFSFPIKPAYKPNQSSLILFYNDRKKQIFFFLLLCIFVYFYLDIKDSKAFDSFYNSLRLNFSGQWRRRWDEEKNLETRSLFVEFSTWRFVSHFLVFIHRTMGIDKMKRKFAFVTRFNSQTTMFRLFCGGFLGKFASNLHRKPQREEKKTCEAKKFKSLLFAFRNNVLHTDNK